MSQLRTLLTALLCASASVFARPAMAAPCGRPDVDLTFPPHDATSVPPNALLSAHYASPALYDDEAVSLVDATGVEVELAVTYDAADSLLRATPTAQLRPGFHELTWPGLRGVSGSGVGRGKSVHFFVQTSLDEAPPRFTGLREIAWDLSRDRDPCLDRLEDRFVFELDLGEASDDASTELLQVLVFETREPGKAATGVPERVALRAWPASGKLEVRRPAHEPGETCFAALVQDLRGNVSGGGEREACITTEEPPFFDGCSTVVAAPRPLPAWALLLAGLAWLSSRRGARVARRPSH